MADERRDEPGCIGLLPHPRFTGRHVAPQANIMAFACCLRRSQAARSSRTVRYFSSGLAFDKGPMQFGVPVVRARGASGTTRSKTRTAACRAVLPGGLLKEVNHGRR